MKKFILILLTYLCLCNFALAEELMQVPLVMHIASSASDGRYSVADIVRIARENNIRVVIINERDLMRWEYGIWPLRNIIKKTVEYPSLFQYGLKRYLKEFEDIQRKNPDMVLIPGLESAPYYYWQGSIFKNNLSLRNWHKHILVIGLENAGAIRNMPVIGNPQGLIMPWTFKGVFFYLFFPVALIVLGAFCLYKKNCPYPDRQRQHLVLFSCKIRTCGIFFIAIGILFLANNYPFRDYKFDQYQGDLGILPYQNLIDYVNRNHGLTFWAHPDIDNFQRTSRVMIETPEHSNDLLLSRGYTGFSVFYEGYKRVGIPGGIWDEVLGEYCKGKRKTPAWAIAGLSFDNRGKLGEYIADCRTMLLLPGFNKSEVLNALRQGRMYALRGKDSSQFILDKFIVKAINTNSIETIGGELKLKVPPQIEISGRFLNGQTRYLTVKLIKNGFVIKTYDVVTPFDIFYLDDNPHKEKKSYYRLDIQGDGLMLVSNPIFVDRE